MIFNTYKSSESSDRIEGIVYKVTEEKIVVAFKEMHDFVSNT